jgi:energy-coupling factor transport system permease protein
MNYNEFEYSRNLPFGQVVPGDSPVHRLDARARILVFFILLSAVLFTPHAEGLLLGLAAVLLGLRLARLPVGYALRALLSPLPFLIILALLQVLFNAQSDTGTVLLALGPVIITPLDLLVGGMLILRFAGLVIGISFASQVLSVSEMAHGLEALFAPLATVKVPVHDAVMALVVAVRFLPFLAQSAERIAKAQAARGADWTRPAAGRNPFKRLWARARALLPLLVPIFVTSLRRAETMALAMDARGYASRAERATSLIELRWSPRDTLALGIAFMLAAGIIIL